MMGINYYYYEQLRQGKIIIDFGNTDSLTKFYILTLVVPREHFMSDKSLYIDEKLLKKRYYRYNGKKFIGITNVKSYRKEDRRIISHTELINKEAKRPILNLIKTCS